MRIVMIGSGNVATHLGKAFQAAGHKIVQVYSNTAANAELLAKELKCGFTIEIKMISTDSDVYFIALKDDSIEEFVNKFQNKGKTFIHTSGSASIDILKNGSDNYGVLYPLQSFNKSKVLDLSEIPIFIEANNEETRNIIKTLTSAISKHIHEITSEQRLTLHVAAVFVNNFTNHMYRIAEDILITSGIEFAVLKPLIKESVEKVMKNSPAEVQTGPAARKDRKTIKKQLELLKGFPDYRQIYEILSESIEKQMK